MIQWTTPSIKCNIPDGLDFDYILLTIRQGDYSIERKVWQEQVVDNSFTVYFTQEETSAFKLLTKVEAQLNVMKGGVRIATTISELCVSKNLHDEFIDPDLPTQLTITENGIYNVAEYRTVDVMVSGGGGEEYKGSYTVVPKVIEQILPTKAKMMIKDLTVTEITYSVFDNEKGLTVQIGEI